MFKASILLIFLCFTLVAFNGCAIASSARTLPESNHPYLNDFEHTWTIKYTGAPQIRLHFENIKLVKDDGLIPHDYDKLILLDKYDNELTSYGGYWGFEEHDFWTDWYTGDTLKAKLVTDSSGTSYGFKIDNVESRADVNASINPLPESDHPYASNFDYTWPAISEPGVAKIRLHFENLALSDKDKLVIYDKFGNVLKIYSSLLGLGNKKENFWTDWYPVDTLKVELTTDSSGTDYGFKIDNFDYRQNEANSTDEWVTTSNETISNETTNNVTTGSLKVPVSSTEDISSFETTSSQKKVTNNNYGIFQFFIPSNGKISFIDITFFDIQNDVIPMLEHQIPIFILILIGLIFVIWRHNQ